jgi:hypothetical protein
MSAARWFTAVGLLLGVVGAFLVGAISRAHFTMYFDGQGPEPDRVAVLRQNVGWSCIGIGFLLQLVGLFA